MAIYLVEILDMEGRGTGKFKEDTRPGADIGLVRSRVESDHLRIEKVIYPGPNY